MLSIDWYLICADSTSVPVFDDHQSYKIAAPITVARACLDHNLDMNAIVAAGKSFWFVNLFHGQGPQKLIFEGLTVPSYVYFNGALLCMSPSMYLQFECTTPDLDISILNQLSICFTSSFETIRLPRPRWRQKMIDESNLRSARNTLLGSMPGSCPSVKPLGILNTVRCITPEDPVLLQSFSIEYEITGNTVILKIHFVAHNFEDGHIKIDDDIIPISKVLQQTCEYEIANVKWWFPHTHGVPFRYKIDLVLDNKTFDLGYRAFRSIGKPRDFTLSVNDVDIFCRGALWSTVSIIDLTTAKVEDYRNYLELVRDGGMNMIRVPGTSLYERQEFYDICDELGIMVWQDFMFANFDYPQTEDFTNLVIHEAVHFLERTAHNACLVVLCGGSEVFQQAAMLGLPQEKYTHSLFEYELKQVTAKIRKDVVYIENSPFGGEWPFQTNTGVTHYYGVGAYLRDFTDIRRSEVKFASECLALSNIPCNATVRQMNTQAVHHPSWKAAVPRDNGVSWDFEDVRDHYLQTIFNVDANLLRRTHQSRYLELSRAVSCILVTEVFSEWRKHGSGCGGGLILSLMDLSRGAGWGIIDNDGIPKAVYYALQRVSQSIQVVITDEGINGLDIHVINETNDIVEGILNLNCYRDGEFSVAGGVRDVILQPRSSQCISSRQLVKGFFDITYSYKFGPPSHNVTAVQLLGDDTELISQAFNFPLGYVIGHEQLGMLASIIRQNNKWYLIVTTKKFAHLVHIDIPGFYAKQDWVDIAPGMSHRTELVSCVSSDRIPQGYVLALNQTAIVAVRAE